MALMDRKRVDGLPLYVTTPTREQMESSEEPRQTREDGAGEAIAPRVGPRVREAADRRLRGIRWPVWLRGGQS